MPRSLANLDLDLVRTFATIASLGSFTRAAARLGSQQSTISLQVQRLEETLGLKLLQRTPRSVALTSDGESFLQSARRILDLNDEIIARTAALEKQISTSLDIAVDPAAGDSWYYASYDPPFRISNRHNEVWVPVVNK